MAISIQPTLVGELSLHYGISGDTVKEVFEMDRYWSDDETSHLRVLPLERLSILRWATEVTEVDELPTIPTELIDQDPRLTDVIKAMSHIGVCNACRTAMHQFDCLAPPSFNPSE